MNYHKLLISILTLLYLFLVQCGLDNAEIKKRAMDAYNNGSYQECISVLEEYFGDIQEESLNWAHYTLGDCYLQTNNPQKALINFQAIQSQPNLYPLLWEKIHFAYIQLEEYQKDIEFLKQQLETNPYSVEILYSLGDVYLSLSDEKALDFYNQALEVNPNVYYVYHKLVEYYTEVYPKPDKAINILTSLFYMDELDENEYTLFLELLEEVNNEELYAYIKQKYIFKNQDNWLSHYNELMGLYNQADLQSEAFHLEIVANKIPTWMMLNEDEKNNIIENSIRYCENWMLLPPKKSKFIDTFLSWDGQTLYLLYGINNFYGVIQIVDVDTGRLQGEITLSNYPLSFYQHNQEIYVLSSNLDDASIMLSAYQIRDLSQLWNQEIAIPRIELGMKTIFSPKETGGSYQFDRWTGEKIDVEFHPFTQHSDETYLVVGQHVELLHYQLVLDERIQPTLSLDSSVFKSYRSGPYLIFISSTGTIYNIKALNLHLTGRLTNELILLPSVKKFYKSLRLSAGSTQEINMVFNAEGNEYRLLSSLGPDFIQFTGLSGVVDYTENTIHIKVKMDVDPEAITGTYYVSIPIYLSFEGEEIGIPPITDLLWSHYAITIR